MNFDSQVVIYQDLPEARLVLQTVCEGKKTIRSESEKYEVIIVAEETSGNRDAHEKRIT